MKADEHVKTLSPPESGGPSRVVELVEWVEPPSELRPERPYKFSQVAAYLGALTLARSFGDPSSFLNIPTLFLLKDGLRLGAQSVALFQTLTLVPHYLAFFIGVLRDRWRRSGVGDRTYLLVAAPAAAGIYLWLASGPQEYWKLLAGMVLAMVAYQFLDTAGLVVAITVGQQRANTGRLSALTELLDAVGGVGAAIAGGWMASHVSFRTVLLVAAGISLAIFVQGFWKPASVFPAENRENSRERGWLKRLFRHPPMALTSGIFLLYNCAPGAGTPLFYFLTDRVQMSAAAFGAFEAVLFGGSAAATLVYGVLYTRIPFKRLLRWAVLANSFPVLLFLWIDNPVQGIVLGGLLGVVGGFGQVALMDLLMRSCPRDLEGAASMLCLSLFGVAGAVGDLAGAWLYERSGFGVCVVADATVTLLILPLVLRLPPGLTGGRS